MDIERLDILLTDVIMPGGVHGGELADAVRKASPGTKVVFMSGYPDHELVAKGITDPGLVTNLSRQVSAGRIS